MIFGYIIREFPKVSTIHISIWATSKNVLCIFGNFCWEFIFCKGYNKAALCVSFAVIWIESLHAFFTHPVIKNLISSFAIDSKTFSLLKKQLVCYYLTCNTNYFVLFVGSFWRILVWAKPWRSMEETKAQCHSHHILCS